MKLPKAIEILTNSLRGDEPDNAPDLPAAIRLGIEAIKECEKARAGNPALDGELLPGETPEDTLPEIAWPG